MSEHYFSQQPQSESSPRTWRYQLKGKEYTFTSDHGVFAKNEVDFGSKLLIETFTEPNAEGNLLDLGCGYGPIGIVLADHFSGRAVILADINERAMKLAQENAVENDVKNAGFVESDRFSNLSNRKFAAIITNPPIRAGKKVVHAMLEESKQALADHGELWIVIQKKQGAPSAKEKMQTVFGNVEIVARSKGYYIFRAINS